MFCNLVHLIYEEQLYCAAGQQVSAAAAVGETTVPRCSKAHGWQHRDTAIGHQHAVGSEGQPHLHAIAFYSYAPAVYSQGPTMQQAGIPYNIYHIQGALISLNQ